MIIEISIVPIGVGESLSGYVSQAVKIIEEKGLDYRLNPMGTVIELKSFSELGELLDEIIRRLEEEGVPRVYVVVKADWRKKATGMDYKVKVVEEKLRTQYPHHPSEGSIHHRH
ncbi:MAG: thiamine-binding protein [Archaeoglobales archaeon]|nr:MAG: thiamine-binding protein [Archaeoglobales archaeon]